jgi:arylsulfatase A-like enzyme
VFRDPEQEPQLLRVNPFLTGRGGIPNYQFLRPMRDFYDYEANYDGEIRYMDHHFGALTDQLKKLGLFDDSLIIFTSDHGEAMGERNIYFSHGEYLYENLIRVPMILKLGRTAPVRRKEVCQHIDVVPTILSFAGLPLDRRFRGRDLARAELPDVEIFAYTRSLVDRDGEKNSVIAKGFKLIRNVQSGRVELFDLAADPRERNDLSKDLAHVERIRELAESLDQLLADDRLQLGSEAAPELSEEELEPLRALGYVK